VRRGGDLLIETIKDNYLSLDNLVAYEHVKTIISSSENKPKLYKKISSLAYGLFLRLDA
jgi:hypothetical protein